MSNQQYDTNNDIVRYQGTISEFNNDKNDEDKKYNYIYAFDEELADTLNNYRQKFNNKDIIFTNQKENYNSDKRDYSNNTFDIDFICSESFRKENENKDFLDKPVSPLNINKNNIIHNHIVPNGIFKKKIITNEHNSTNFELSLNDNSNSRNNNCFGIYQKNVNSKTVRNSVVKENLDDYKNLSVNKLENKIENKFDLNKFKINPMIENPIIKNPQTAKNKVRNVEKFILKNNTNNNLNNTNKYNIKKVNNKLIDYSDEYFEEEKQKINLELNDIIDDDEEEESPLTLDIIQSIKPRNPVPYNKSKINKKKNESVEKINTHNISLARNSNLIDKKNNNLMNNYNNNNSNNNNKNEVNCNNKENNLNIITTVGTIELENNSKKILEYERSPYSKGLLQNNLKDKNEYTKSSPYINLINDIKIKESEIPKKGKIKRRKSTDLPIIQNLESMKDIVINDYINNNENEEKSQILSNNFKSENINDDSSEINEVEKKKYKTNEVDNFQTKNKYNLNHNEGDIELQYLEKLSKLKKENNKLLEENKIYIQEIEKLKIDLENKKKEEINYKASYDTIIFEYDALNKKFEEIKENFKLNETNVKEVEKLKNENENYKNKINELNVKVNSLENTIKDLENINEKNKTENREIKNSLELMKNNYNEVKTQYDVLLMKINTINEENYSLKRELLLYKNSNNNNINRLNDYDKMENNKNLQVKNNFSMLQKNKNNNSKGKIIRSSYEITSEDYNKNSMLIKKDISFNIPNNNINPIIKNNSNLNKNKPIETITNSHRKFIGINQNDSSGVSSLLTINIDAHKDNNSGNIINKKKKIVRQKSLPSGNLDIFPSEAEIIKNEAKINKIEHQIIEFQKERDKYNDELSKFPEHPKQQSLIHQKINIENIINNLNFRINSCKKEVREIKEKLYG